MMSSTGDQRRSLGEAMRRVYNLGGMRAFYRGLHVCSLYFLRACTVLKEYRLGL